MLLFDPWIVGHDVFWVQPVVSTICLTKCVILSCTSEESMDWLCVRTGNFIVSESPCVSTSWVSQLVWGVLWVNSCYCIEDRRLSVQTGISLGIGNFIVLYTPWWSTSWVATCVGVPCVYFPISTVLPTRLVLIVTGISHVFCYCIMVFSSVSTSLQWNQQLDCSSLESFPA